jgi:hypothetical protein
LVRGGGRWAGRGERDGPVGRGEEREGGRKEGLEEGGMTILVGMGDVFDRG